MLVGIYKADNAKNTVTWNDKYKKILDYNNIDFIEMNLDNYDFWENVKKIDLFIFRWIHFDTYHQIVNAILPVIEKGLNIKCFPNFKTCWHYDDKIKQFYFLKSQGYPFIESWVFWNRASALNWSETAKFPVVFKLKKGAGSTNVVLLKNKNEAKKIITRMFGRGIKHDKIPMKSNVHFKNFKHLLKLTYTRLYKNKINKIEFENWEISKNYVLFQKFLPNNSYDTRVTTIGDKVFAFKRLVRENDFRASGSGKIDFNPNNIDLRCIEIALKISQEQGFQTMAYDFLFNEKDEPEICEISYTYADYAVQNCPGYWDKNIKWHEGHYWPQYLQIKHALNLSELKQPTIENPKFS